MKKIITALLTIVSISAIAQDKATLKKADSLFLKQEWKASKQAYLSLLKDTSTNSISWTRLGYCNQNLGMFDEAMKDYNKSLANNPRPAVRSITLARMARIYSLTNMIDEATDRLIKSTALGYNSLPDLDTLADFKNIRQAPNFADIRKKVYETVYPCAGEPNRHDFDFWIGEWDVYQTGTQQLVGHSSVQSMSGACAILENWTSTQANTGKSFNYYDESVGKWEQDWLGAGGPSDRQRFYNGVYENGIMHFTFETKDAQGNKQTGNFRFYNIDKDTVRQYSELSSDGGKTYQVSYDFTYIRKKS